MITVTDKHKDNWIHYEVKPNGDSFFIGDRHRTFTVKLFGIVLWTYTVEELYDGELPEFPANKTKVGY